MFLKLLMREELICPITNCRNIPLIQFHNNTPYINIKCSLHENNNKLYNIKEYLDICSNSNNRLQCSNCHKNLGQNDLIFFCSRCKKLFDNNCSNNSKCYKNSEHKKVETNYNKYSDKILCFIHNKTYNIFCKTCKIPFCRDCKLNNHDNHDIINIVLKLKQKNEIIHLQNKLNIIESTFEKLKKNVLEYFFNIENQIKLKKLILKNYENNSYNGNSLENLDNINLIINETYKKKIDDLFNKKGNYDERPLGIYYFYLMNKRDIDKDNQIKLNYIQNDLINLRNFEDENEINNINRNRNINLLKKNFIEEENENNNIRNTLKINHINIKGFELKERNNNHNENSRDNSNNIRENENNKKELNNFIPLERGKSLNSIIKIITDKSKILSITKLSSGNLALGFMNGYIKIYNLNFICLKNNNINEQDKSLILTIDKFKGRRISYIYELKDGTLLCCTFSKILHIRLKNDDRDYDYLGLIKLSNYEIPKKIIELGNDLIVSLGEKNYRDENRIHNKSIIKIFTKVNMNANNSENNSVISDYDNIGSSINSSSSEWENFYSNEEDEPMNDKEEVLMEDQNIKIYKKNKNYDNLYFCSMFGTKIVKCKDDSNIYEFILTSNKLFNEGEDCVVFYGVLKKFQRHGYNFFIDKKIENLSCSKMVNSICKISTKNIGIALQKYKQNDNNGIAIIDINEKNLIRVVNGFNIGIIYREFTSPYIFFTISLNENKNKKHEQFRYVNNLEQKLDHDHLKIICNIKKQFSEIIEIKPNLRESSNNLFFFGLLGGGTLYIISVKK